MESESARTNSVATHLGRWGVHAHVCWESARFRIDGHLPRDGPGWATLWIFGELPPPDEFDDNYVEMHMDRDQLQGLRDLIDRFLAEADRCAYTPPEVRGRTARRARSWAWA